jgi:hypothetical protein
MALTTTMARVKQRVDALRLSMKIPARTVASLANISSAKLSNGLLGVSYLGSETEARLAELTLTLEELEIAAAPLTLPTDEIQLRKLLDHMKEHTVTADDVRKAIQNLFGVTQ